MTREIAVDEFLRAKAIIDHENSNVHWRAKEIAMGRWTSRPSSNVVSNGCATRLIKAAIAGRTSPPVMLTKCWDVGPAGVSPKATFSRCSCVTTGFPLSSVISG